MKITTILVSMLLVVTFATVGFCADAGTVEIINNTNEAHVVKIKASIPTGYIQKASKIVAAGGKESISITLQKSFELLEYWDVDIYEITGFRISQSLFRRIKKNVYTVTKLGPCITYSTSGHVLKVTLTK